MASLYGSYDDFYSNNPSPSQLGGQHRAENAMRDELGRFMPVGVEAVETWTLDPEHGKKGGMVNAATCKRDNKGRFA